MLRITDVVKHLLFINILMFLATDVLRFIDPDLFALHFPSSEKFQPFQIATHFFMHANFAHIFFNMFALVMFGSALESFWGPRRFLFFYFVSAFGAAILHTLWMYYDISQFQELFDQFQQQPSYDAFWAFFNQTPYPDIAENARYLDQLSLGVEKADPTSVSRSLEEMAKFIKLKMDVPVVGASGAIYGLLLAFGMYFPNAELMLIFFPVPIKAKYFIPLLMLAELFLGFNQYSWDNIAHFAHLGGALAGLLLILYWRKIQGTY